MPLCRLTEQGLWLIASIWTDNNKITNSSTDAADALSAANVRHVNQVKADLVVSLTASFNKKINESHQQLD